MVIDKTYILDILPTESIEQTLTKSSRSFAICVQRMWAILYDADNEKE